MNHNDGAEMATRLSALALPLEDEGQYNTAKLLRAMTESLTRRAAYQVAPPPDKNAIVQEIAGLDADLARLEVNPDVRAALQQGASSFAQGKLTLFRDIPNPYVCRTCGYLVLDEPKENCPTCGARPATFYKFMPNYWFDALDPFAALETMKVTPARFAELLGNRTEEELNHLPQNGGWAIRNVITHLRDAQEVLAFRLNLMLEQDNPPLESLAVYAWADKPQEKPETTREIFDAYSKSRQGTIETLESIPLKDWWRKGQHQEFGPVTLRQQVSYFVSHEITHLPQVDALLA